VDLPGYDNWKLSTPPEYEQRDTCPDCGEQFEEQFECKACGWSPEDEEDAYWRHIDNQIDERRGK
jgi:hypothetical protein